MKVLIIEDEPLVAKSLQKSLASLQPTWEIVATLGSVQKSVMYLKNNPAPDLAFMDIQLADGASFEIFEQVEVLFPVIFTTAYDQYAIRAFQVNSIGYLLKPIDETELAQTIEKYHKIQKTPSQNLHIQISTLLQDLKKPSYKERFLVNFKGGFIPIPIEEIACFEKDEIIFIHTFDEKKYVCDYATMDELEQCLPPHYFYRANRQFIIHLNAVGYLKPTYKGIAIKLKLSYLPELEVSREKVSHLKNWLAPQ